MRSFERLCRTICRSLLRSELIEVETSGLTVAYKGVAGPVLDFHALRHTFVTNPVRECVHPKVAQQLARHSTITLTMDRYAHTVAGELSDALDKLRVPHRFHWKWWGTDSPSGNVSGERPTPTTDTTGSSTFGALRMGHPVP